MTERESAQIERATACPFVAYDDDRDERSDRPDHRHRCYAELRPAPRAIAHQEAYCLSAGFAACPTFQDWARREAARARATGRSAGQAAPDAPLSSTRDERGSHAGQVELGAAAVAGTGSGEPDDIEDDPVFRPRPIVREWAAPPPWAPPGSVQGSEDSNGEEVPAGGAGLAASRWLVDGPTRERDTATGGRAGGDAAAAGGSTVAATGTGGSSAEALREAAHTPAFLSGRAATTPDDEMPARPELAALVRRPRPVAARGARPAVPRPPTTEQARPAQRVERDEGTPAWERPRRFEAYPTLKTRVGMPNLSPLVVAVAALVIAALLLFNLPALFLSSAPQGGRSSPTTSPEPTASVAPTPKPQATPTTYTVKAGDNLASIAKRFGVTQKQILNANPDIKDPNKIQIGQVIVIPLKQSNSVDSASPSPSAS
jgi:nucleoid-associated protein YgaU